MMSMMGTQAMGWMMLAMGLFSLLALVAFVLLIAALIKYLRS